MSHTWDEIKRAVERVQDADLLDQQAAAELRARGGWQARLARARPFLQVLGGVVLGLHTAIGVLAFNYLLFVWILHVNFAF